MGGVSNVRTRKLCLTISQSFSRFLKCKTPQQLRISENLRDERMQNTSLKREINNLITPVPEFFFYRYGDYQPLFNEYSQGTFHEAVPSNDTFGGKKNSDDS